MAVEAGSKDNNWEQMKLTMTTAIGAIESAFPNTIILPVIGNNDVVYHD